MTVSHNTTNSNKIKIKRCPTCGGVFPLTKEFWYNTNKTNCKKCILKKASDSYEKRKACNHFLYLNGEKAKRCSVCGEIFPLTFEFFNKKSRKYGSKDGFRSECKTCRNKKRQEARAKNQKHYSEYGKKWREENPDKVKAAANKNNKYGVDGWKKEARLKKIKKQLEQKSSKAQPLVVNIFGMKRCTKCGKEYPNNEEFFRFRADYANPDLNTVCKICDSHKSKKHANKKVKFNSRLFKELSTFDDTRVDPNNKNLGQVKCAYCGKWINPRNIEVQARVGSSKSINHGECRIYCPGDQCREACPTYKQQFYPKGFKKNSSREVDPLIRHMCMELDNYTCQMCGANGEGVTLHAHHILSYARNKMVANDIHNVITLCKACHNEVHHMKGCGYHELRRELCVNV